MIVDKKTLKKMIMEEKISYQLQKEGVFDDYMKRAKQKGTTAQSFADKNADLRARLDKILGKSGESSPPGSFGDADASPEGTPTTTLAPSGDLETEPILPAEPIDPEDMIEPEEQPIPSDDGSFDLLFSFFDPEEEIYNTLDLIASLLPLANITTVQNPKFTEIAQSLAQYYAQRHRIPLDDLSNLTDNPQVMQFYTQLGWALPQETLDLYYTNPSEWDDKLAVIEDSIGRIDPKTGLSQGLYRMMSKFWELGSFEEIVKAYPAMLHFAKKIGGSQAEEKLKDIMINLGYMKPEDTGREKEGPLKRIYSDMTRQQRMNKALDGIGY